MNARLFQLVRETDPFGVSGTGAVATGVEFEDGSCVIRWTGAYRSTAVWDSVADVLTIHGHSGATRVEYMTGGENHEVS